MQGSLGGCVAAQAAAQNGSQPRQQFTRLEGLRQIVIGADFQAHNPINRIAAPRQHENRCVGAGPQPPAHIQPVHVGQHQIENDGVILGSRQAFERGSPQGRNRDAKTRLTQIL